MWNVRCPACGKPAFAWVIKVLLGPVHVVPCASCKASVGLPALPLLAVALLFIAYVFVAVLPDSPLQDGRTAGIVFAAIVLGWGLWFVRLSPIRKEERGEAEEQ